MLLGFVFGVSSLSKAGFCTGTLVGLGVILALVAGELLEALGVFARDLLEERVDMFCETILVWDEAVLSRGCTFVAFGPLFGDLLAVLGEFADGLFEERVDTFGDPILVCGEFVLSHKGTADG